MKIPAPRRPVRGSRTGRPIMALLDLLGRRMALRVLWELSRLDQGCTFRALQTAAETNPSVLNSRLKELRAAGLVLHDDAGYRLSAEGKALLQLILPLHAWAESWSARSSAETQDRRSSTSDAAGTKARISNAKRRRVPPRRSG
jgi:DNA-binding HxlR family transcriptional regulator